MGARASAAGRPGTDEASADEARRRLREQGIVPIEPDDRIGPLLEPDELLLAVRRSTFLDRRQPRRDDAPGLHGDLYVTTRRLVHLGRLRVCYALEEIREADVAGSQLRLVVAENRGVALDVADPGVLRVEIGAAGRPPGPMSGALRSRVATVSRPRGSVAPPRRGSDNRACGGCC